MITYVLATIICFILSFGYSYYMMPKMEITKGEILALIVVSLIPFCNVLIASCIIWNLFWKGMDKLYGAIINKERYNNFCDTTMKFLCTVVIKPRK